MREQEDPPAFGDQTGQQPQEQLELGGFGGLPGLPELDQPRVTALYALP